MVDGDNRWTLLYVAARFNMVPTGWQLKLSVCFLFFSPGL